MTDYIKRENAIELINKCVSHTSPKAKVMDFRHGEMNGLNWACDIVEALSSADVAPVRHGRWIDDERYVDGYYANCSECGWQLDMKEERGYHNYCPNCGAHMMDEEK